MSQIIKPTVGRVVHFFEDGKGPQLALIASVWSDNCVNIALFDADGKPDLNPPTSVDLIQPGTDRPGTGIWVEWPLLDHDASHLNLHHRFGGASRGIPELTRTEPQERQS